MFIRFLCFCPLRLAIMLNFNISKVAYWRSPAQPPHCYFDEQTSVLIIHDIMLNVIHLLSGAHG